MKPLTIEELKALPVGDWVWIKVVEDEVYNIDNGYYEIADWSTTDRAIAVNGVKADEQLPYSLYGKTWLAYKNKEQAEAKGEIVECKIGDEVWVIDYDEDVINYVCIGCNKNFLFLSPTICAQEDFTTPDEICSYYADCYMEDERDTYIMVFPRNKCYKTKPEAERRLAELKGEKV